MLIWENIVYQTSFKQSMADIIFSTCKDNLLYVVLDSLLILKLYLPLIENIEVEVWQLLLISEKWKIIFQPPIN